MNGAQTPRICSFPDYKTSAGGEAAELAEMAGLVLDEWQRFVLDRAMGERPDGKWAAPTVGLVVGRQNGKNAVLEARELAGLFLLGEEVIIHSAHEQATSSEHFRRLLSRIQGVPEFERRILKVSHGKGAEAIELLGGQRILFKTRTGGGGRGFSVDLLVYDEAMILSASAKAALVPTLASRSMHGNTQTWYAGSAVDEQNPKHDGVELARIRDGGIKGKANIAYFEWSAPGDGPEALSEAEMADPDVWALANPGLGIRISQEWIDHERLVELGSREFSVERLGVGAWPPLDAGAVINLERWQQLTDTASRIVGPVCFAYDVTPDRSSAAIAAAGLNPDGHLHVEIVERRPGTGWLVSRLSDLARTHSPEAVVCDSIGPGASLVTELEQAGVRVSTVNGREHANACGLLYDLVEQSKLRHLGTPELGNAVRGAGKRPLGDAWLWSRRHSAVDISPLVAVTLAAWQASSAQESVYERRGLLVLG